MSAKIHTDSDITARSELPSSFIDAMRTLFDIMDVNKSGMIRFRDIETRWQDDPRKGLPKGVIENLRKVTQPSGLITFSQFCAGLKLCLEKIKSDDSDSKDVNNNRNDPIRCRSASVPIPSYIRHSSTAGVKKNDLEHVPEAKQFPSHACSKPLVDTHKGTHANITRSVSSRPTSSVNRPNTARVKPNNVNVIAQRATSMPHLGEKYSHSGPNGNHQLPGFPSPPPFVAPPPPFVAPPPVKTYLQNTFSSNSRKDTGKNKIIVS